MDQHGPTATSLERTFASDDPPAASGRKLSQRLTIDNALLSLVSERRHVHIDSYTSYSEYIRGVENQKDGAACSCIAAASGLVKINSSPAMVKRRETKSKADQ